MPLHHKVEELLKPDELEELRAWIAEKNATRTTDQVHDWLLSRGFTIGRTAVGNWLQKLREELMRERFNRSGELARAIKATVNGGDFNEVADAAVMQLTQVVFEQAARLEADGEIDAKQLAYMTKSLKDLARTRGEVIELKKKQADAMKEAEKLAASGRSAGDVVATIKQALGIGA